MQYISTRNAHYMQSPDGVIREGISPEGGLYLPAVIPTFSAEQMDEMISLDYCGRAETVLSMYFPGMAGKRLHEAIISAYSHFSHPAVAPLKSIGDGISLLEIYHGPTCAFKDVALQLLPHLMTWAQSVSGEGLRIVILTATSGDTGKAALAGFADVPGTEIIVFYPDEGVSPIQKLQMVTQEGLNTCVAAVRGNFDATQNGVKAIFTDPEAQRRLRDMGCRFSSANSINWGRLAPQIVYYLSAWLDLVSSGKLAQGEPFNICVPTGNFGNILAAWYARCMGAPVHKLICASNQNNVLTDFIRDGVYDKNRPFYKTMSPSMDILISSNLERLLFELTGRDDAYTALLMGELKEKGRYSISGDMQAELSRYFWGAYATEDDTARSLRDIYREKSVLIDPHTAVGTHVADLYRRETGDTRPMIVASTASPFKFATDVLACLEEESTGDPDGDIQKLSELTGEQVPVPLTGLSQRPVRHHAVCDQDEMADVIDHFLHLRPGGGV